MKVTATDHPEVLLFEPRVFGDDRGYFYESFSQRVFDAAVEHSVSFVQDNQSASRRGVLRGLHYQMPPHAQGKLVRVAEGEIFDVAVDIRRSSIHFGKWVGFHLSAANKRQLWIPPGFAHGFLTLSETAVLLYKTTNYYTPSSERIIRWDDGCLDIAWPQLTNQTAVTLSDQDLAGLSFRECEFEL